MKIKVYYVELDPKLEDREFDLGSIFKLKNECTIGRSPESDLVLDSPDLSRSHGRIISKNGNYYFIDLGSRNGSLFNDRLTTPSEEYLLNRDDTIRIGDFVLKMEEEEEQAATVFKVIDPALFKSKQPPVENSLTPEAIVSPISPVVELAQNAALTPPSIDELDDEVSVAPVIETHPPVALVVDEFDDRNTFVQLGENRPAALIVDELDDEAPVIPVVETHPPAVLVINEFDDLSTFVQLGENRPATLIVDELDDEVPVIPVVEAHPPVALIADELDDNELPIVPIVETHPPTAFVIDELDDDDKLPVIPVVEPHPPAALVIDELDDDEVSVIPVVEPHPPAALVIDELDDDEVSVVPVEPHPPAALVVDELDDDENPVVPVIEPHSAAVLVVDELDDDELPVVEEHSATALVADELEEVNIKIEQSSSVPIAAIAADNAVELNTPNKRFGAELLKQKQIVLIAHDEKITDLIELIDRNKDFLATCLTISWAPISDSLRQETGMVVSKEIANGATGGYQALAGLVNSGDVLAVIFLRDLFAQNQAGKANEEAMLRLCNINEILLGTNITTADAIVHYLQS
jgi:methylglyoxal synthase